MKTRKFATIFYIGIQKVNIALKKKYNVFYISEAEIFKQKRIQKREELKTKEKLNNIMEREVQRNHEYE